MNTIMLAMLGWPEIVAIMVIVLVMFGARKVPELMRGLGEGIREFKRASREIQDGIEEAIYEDSPPRKRKPSDASSTKAMATPTLDAKP